MVEKGDFLEHLMLSSAEKLYGEADFLSLHALQPAYSAKTTSNWFGEHGITVLDCPANCSDLNLRENLWRVR